jgi:hypothetical protein
MQKKLAIFVLNAMLLFSTSALVFSNVQAQSNATVIVTSVTGGTTDVTGTNTYSDGTSFTITATPGDSYAFVSWTVSTDSSSTNNIDNPLTITLSGGTTYTIQPNFEIVLAPPGLNLPTNMSNAAIVIVLAAAGGSTSPAPGTYAMADASTMQLKATASSGWQFLHWTICGSSMSHGGYPLNYAPADNPYTVGHGYGYTYYYQPVFSQVGSPTATSTASPSSSSPANMIGGIATDTWIIVALIIVIIAMAIGFAAYSVRRKK